MNAPIVVASPSDAVAVAPTLFGFQPVESVVLLGMRRHTVIFSARVDLAGAFDAAATILNAAADSGVDRLDMIGYSQQPTEVAALMTDLSRGPFDGMAGAQHVTDGTHAWRVHNGVLCDKEPFVAPDTLPQPTATRDDAVSAVTEPRTPASLHTVTDRLAALTADQQLAELYVSIISDTPLHPTDAAIAAGVLHEATSAINLVIDAIHDNPTKSRDHLTAMRRHSATEHLPAVLAMLAIACWASDSSAQTTTVRDEFEHHLPDSPLIGLIDRLTCTNPHNWRNNA